MRLQALTRACGRILNQNCFLPFTRKRVLREIVPNLDLNRWLYAILDAAPVATVRIAVSARARSSNAKLQSRVADVLQAPTLMQFVRSHAQMTRAANAGGMFMKFAKISYLILLNLIGALAGGQAFELDAAADGRGDSGYQTKWDSTHSRLLVFRDTSAPDIPSARIFGANGTSVPIFILRDFRDAKFSDVWAGAATPEGGIVLSVILGFGDRPNPKDQSKSFPPLKSLVLTYGPDGSLKKVWNVAPYQHQALAVDLLGNVFALGTRDAGPEGFPMLIKYSPSGAILGEYIPSKMFPIGAKALDGSALNGSPALFIRNQHLVLWVSSTREAFRLSLNGELQRKIAVGPTIDRLATQNGFAQGTIAGLALEDSGGLAVQVRFWPSITSVQGMMLGMVNISPEGTEVKLINPPTGVAVNTQQFLGITQDGKSVVLEFAGKGHALVRKQ